MTYPENIESKIGFDSVRESIAAGCSSALGRELVAEMSFSDNYRTVRTLLGRTAEMLDIIKGDAGLDIGSINDRRHTLLAIRVPGTAVAESDLPGLRACLEAMASISSFFSKNRNEETNETPYPFLDALAADMLPFPAIIVAIDRIIDPHGIIRDNASPELADIRRSMHAAEAAIGATMRRVMANAVREGFLEPDATPSVRDGRLVIPVAPMYKRKISGIVHDESASGKTFYIEPAEVVEANNRLRELSLEERREIHRILQALADVMRPHIDEMIAGFGLLGQFDFIMAKAKYARVVDAEMPALGERPELEWYGACHPVLKLSLVDQGREIVPLDIILSGKNRILVISGPNAGGKSVTLKTVAINQYMLQCGVLPAVYSNSHLGIFKDIFIDIGDDQSIEDDLSTYSSHLRNMKQFVMRGNPNSLILIDEFGSGTEPEIGGAIAQAVLRQLNADGVWGVITTHYHNLKQFAEETHGLVNGSMLYDRQKMQPMFRLAIGQPGSSFAIEIARKTGLPEAIIKDAQEIVGSDYINMDRYLLDIARDRRYWENKRAEIRKKEKQLDDTLARYSDDVEALRRQRREIIGEAKEEARRILDNSNASIERTIRDIRSAQADKEKTRAAREKLRQDREALDNEPESKHPLLKMPKQKKKKVPAAVEKNTLEKPLEVGDNVVLADGGQTVGTIEHISGKEATVVFGSIKTMVKLARLKRTIRKPQGASGSVSYIAARSTEASRVRQLDFNPEIDVRGMRADEAVQAIMYYVDDAIQFNTSRVRILHGTGTGALRQYIRRYLDTVGAVRNYHDEDVRLGGAGITVVEF